MKLELKFISLIFSLGVFSLPVQSQVCPGYQCPNGGPCMNNPSDCPTNIMVFQGKPEYIYLLPEGTSYYCENGQSPKFSAAPTGASPYFICSPVLSLNASPRKPTQFVSKAGTAYSLGNDTAFQCTTGAPIQKGNLWSCPQKTSK